MLVGRTNESWDFGQVGANRQRSHDTEFPNPTPAKPSLFTALAFRMASAEAHNPGAGQKRQSLEPVAYEPKSSLQNAAFVGLQSAGVGVLVSAVQNALDTHNRGAAGILTRTGGTIGFFCELGRLVLELRLVADVPRC